jgi:hypothetical protein
MGNDTCLGFAELFRAAHQRDMDAGEQAALKALDQARLNDWVRAQVAATHGAMWCEDRRGTDGVTYTAFGRVAVRDTDPCATPAVTR